MSEVQHRQQIEEHLKRMVEMFGGLPDPKHQPKKFKYLIEMYKYLNK